MAIAVYPHDEECDPQTEAVQFYYSTSQDELCAGNGTLNNYVWDGSSLATLAQSTTCENGMDIVFLVDYTGSMSTPINGVKAGISNILSTIETESNDNFRLGLVLFDEYNNTKDAGQITYTDWAIANLPSDQLSDSAGQFNSYQLHTCMHKMGSSGDPNAISDFEDSLDLLNTGTFPLGWGGNSPEPSGIGVDMIINDHFAGQFRSDAIKVIVLITDNSPGGIDDAYTSIDTDYFNNSLVPLCSAQGVQVMVQIQPQSGAQTTEYQNLANNTTIPGLYDVVTFDVNGLWVNDSLIPAIEDLCENTVIGTCECPPSGYYMQAYETSDLLLYHLSNTSDSAISYTFINAACEISTNLIK